MVLQLKQVRASAGRECHSVKLTIYGTGGSSYGIVASGRLFMILKWTGTQLYRLDSNNLTSTDIHTSRGLARDLSNNTHRTSAHQVMTAIRALPL